MPNLQSLEDLADLYAARGGRQYGEDVTQLEHALQCAALAEAQGGMPSLVASALLHDVGHLFEGEAEALAADQRHESTGALVLARLFGPDICKPIGLHVAAKRWLCWHERDYFAALSAASQASLALQGGSFDAAQAAAFERAPWWQEAVALRRLDDSGKREEGSGRTFADFMPLLRVVAATRDNF